MKLEWDGEKMKQYGEQYVQKCYSSNVSWHILCKTRGKKNFLSSEPQLARNAKFIPESRKSPGEGNGNPLQYSCLENPMDRAAWWARVHEVTMSWMQLSN